MTRTVEEIILEIERRIEDSNNANFEHSISFLFKKVQLSILGSLLDWIKSNDEKGSENERS